VSATIHLVARFRAKAGKEDELKTVLAALVGPTRRELGCYQYDLLQSPSDPREFCFIERWENERALEQHTASAHLKSVLAEASGLTEGTPEGRRYVLV
jgi:quinol monooxygenase YgiN